MKQTLNDIYCYIDMNMCYIVKDPVVYTYCQDPYDAKAQLYWAFFNISPVDFL